MSNKRETVFETPWFSIEEERNVPQLGNQTFYHYVAPNGVSILAITPDNKIAYIRQYRPAIQSHTLEFPAGDIKPGESSVKAGTRELYEETGLKASRYTVLAKELNMFPSRSSQKQVILVAHDVIQDPKSTPEHGIDLFFATPLELENMIFKGTFKEVIGITAFSLARLKGLIPNDLW